jgi:dienelactone hydrolase
MNRRALTSLLFLLSYRAFTSSAQSAEPPADLVLLHGRIYTIDPNHNVVQAIAVRGDTIVFVGSDAQTAIKKALANKPNVTIYSYPGQRHAFSRHNGAHYNAAAAALANGRTSDFLNQQLR